MYQVNASFRVVIVARKRIGALAKFFGAAETEETEKGGNIQYTAESINEGITKLQYLVQDLSSVTEMSFKKL